MVTFSVLNTDIMYVMLPMALSFFGPGDSLVIISTEGGGWVDAAKFLTGASIIGTIAISSILKHANVIGLGAMFLVFACFLCLVVQHFVIFVWELKTKIAISKDCIICYVSEV